MTFYSDASIDDQLATSYTATSDSIRDSAAHAVSLLRCNDPVLEEWETESPSAGPVYADLEVADGGIPSDNTVGAIIEEPEERVYYPKIPLPGYPPIWSQVSLASDVFYV